MKNPYEETLRKVEENDAGLKSLLIGGQFALCLQDRLFNSTNGDDFSRLGAAIAENTHLTSLVVNLSDTYALDVRNNELYEGIKSNSSIHKLILRCQNKNIASGRGAGGVANEILKAYQQNNNLTELSINYADLRHGGDHVIDQTLRRCTHLNKLNLHSCSITDEQLLPMVRALREHHSLEELHLDRNRIGNDGCGAIATLLIDPISNLHSLDLSNNLIGVDGANTLANGLANNTKLRELYLRNNNRLGNAGCETIATLLRDPNSNINQIDLGDNDIDYEGAIALANGLANNTKLRELYLRNNRIGNVGCETIATLLRDPNSNINHIDLAGNSINNEGAIALANGLTNNTKLKKLYLAGNPIDRSSVDIFKKLLCNKSSIRDTYSSNHTLQYLMLPQLLVVRENLTSLLIMNKCTNKSHVAIKKILKYHPNIDMEPFFEWNMEGEGESDLKALPYVIAWFDRAREAVAGDDKGEESYNIDKRKLSALYQFAKAMPLLFVPDS